MNRRRSVITFDSARASDFEELLELRTKAMRPSLERVGRFDPARSRERYRSTFSPADTQHIVLNGSRVGFVAVKARGEFLHLDHLYIHPDFQGKGIGSNVLTHVFERADSLTAAIKVGALRGSDANRFYQRHGFILHSEEEWDIYYVRPFSGK